MDWKYEVQASENTISNLLHQLKQQPPSIWALDANELEHYSYEAKYQGNSLILAIWCIIRQKVSGAKGVMFTIREFS